MRVNSDVISAIRETPWHWYDHMLFGAALVIMVLLVGRLVSRARKGRR